MQEGVETDLPQEEHVLSIAEVHYPYNYIEWEVLQPVDGTIACKAL